MKSSKNQKGSQGSAKFSRLRLTKGSGNSSKQTETISKYLSKFSGQNAKENDEEPILIDCDEEENTVCYKEKTLCYKEKKATHNNEVEPSTSSKNISESPYKDILSEPIVSGLNSSLSDDVDFKTPKSVAKIFTRTRSTRSTSDSTKGADDAKSKGEKGKKPARQTTSRQTSSKQTSSRQTSSRQTTSKQTKSRQTKITEISRTLEENFSNTDLDGEQLQMAIALSRSLQTENPVDDGQENSMGDGQENLDEDVDACLSSYMSTQEKITNIKKTLEQFGFTSDKAKLSVENKRAPATKVSTKRKKSKFKYITPTLLLRTEEERANMISNKISFILSEISPETDSRISENAPENISFGAQPNKSSTPKPISQELRNNLCPGPKIFHLNNLDAEEFNDIDTFYVPQLPILPTKNNCGCLLKSWSEIPGRDESPHRDSLGNLNESSEDVKSVEGGKKDGKRRWVESIDVESMDVKSMDVESMDVKSMDVESKDVKSMDIESKDAEMDLVNVKNVEMEDVKIGDVEINVKMKNVKMKDVEMEDVKIRDVEKECVNIKDIEEEDVKIKDIEMDDVYIKEVEIEDVSIKDVEIKDMNIKDVEIEDEDVKDVEIPDKIIISSDNLNKTKFHNKDIYSNNSTDCNQSSLPVSRLNSYNSGSISPDLFASDEEDDVYMPLDKNSSEESGILSFLPEKMQNTTAKFADISDEDIFQSESGVCHFESFCSDEKKTPERDILELSQTSNDLGIKTVEIVDISSDEEPLNAEINEKPSKKFVDISSDEEPSNEEINEKASEKFENSKESIEDPKESTKDLKEALENSSDDSSEGIFKSYLKKPTPGENRFSFKELSENFPQEKQVLEVFDLTNDSSSSADSAFATLTQTSLKSSFQCKSGNYSSYEPFHEATQNGMKQNKQDEEITEECSTKASTSTNVSFRSKFKKLLKKNSCSELNLENRVCGGNTSIKDESRSRYFPRSKENTAGSENIRLENINLGNANLDNINLSNINLSNINLSNINLGNINLSNTNLSNTNLRNINLSNINLGNINTENTNSEYSTVKPKKSTSFRKSNSFSTSRDVSLHFDISLERSNGLNVTDYIKELLSNDKSNLDENTPAAITNKVHIIDDDMVENYVDENYVDENYVVENYVDENDVVENYVVESDEVESDEVENDVIENDVIENDVIENDVIENDVIEIDVIENDTVENHIVEADKIKHDTLEDLTEENMPLSQESACISDKELNYSSLHSTPNRLTLGKQKSFLGKHRNFTNDISIELSSEDEGGTALENNTALKYTHTHTNIKSPDIHATSRPANLLRENLLRHPRIRGLSRESTPKRLSPNKNSPNKNLLEDSLSQILNNVEFDGVLDEEEKEGSNVNSRESNVISTKSNVISTENNVISTPENRPTFSKDSGNFIIKTTNVTPMPDFDAMNTPNLLQELKKFGLKPLKRRRGVQILKYIYETTHPLAESNEEGPSEDDDKVVKKRKRNSEGKCKRKLESKLNAEVDNSFRGEKNIEIVENLLEKDSPESLIFEKKQPKKIHSCSVPLQIAWHNFLSSNPEIQDNILMYEPLQLEVLHSMLKDQGFKYDIQDLLTFLDRKCITVRTNQKQGQTRRKRY